MPVTGSAGPRLEASPGVTARYRSSTASRQAGAEEAAALAQKLTNPVADLYSLPFQLNYDTDIGFGDGDRWLLNVQPVLPFDLGDDWLVISRTILPVISQNDVTIGGSDEFGIGDIVQSFFFSPRTEGNLIWGVGPALLLPTASDDVLGQDKWAAGPTGVILKIEGPWTYGGLANHLWDYAGDDGRPHVNATFMQPFVAYTTPTAYTMTLNSESTYDWRSDEWTVPFNALVSRVVMLGKLPVSIGAGIRYYAESPDAGAEGLGLRFIVTPLVPR